jgi:hypothetical protein
MFCVAILLKGLVTLISPVFCFNVLWFLYRWRLQAVFRVRKGCTREEHRSVFEALKLVSTLSNQKFVIHR